VEQTVKKSMMGECETECEKLWDVPMVHTTTTNYRATLANR